MISLIDSTIKLQGEVQVIHHWEVWFQTPFGLCGTLPLAVRRCQDADLDPDTNIIPVPVAIDINGEHEVVYR